MTNKAISEHRTRLQTLLGDEDKKRWVHHVADLEGGDGKVHTLELDRPISAIPRVERVKQVAGQLGSPSFFLETFERKLTPRTPYQESPLSYLNAWANSWALAGDGDSLSWVDWTDTYGEIEFWFRNVTVGSTALVTIEVTAAPNGAGLSGNIEVRSSDAGPRVFPVTGFAEHTLDLIVHPTHAWAVLVSMYPKEQMGYLDFKSIKYQTLS